MLSIRMQRTGRKGHAMFRVVVQESRLTPTSGKVVALLGSYDPHAKVITLNKEIATKFLNNGAQPSERVARLLQSEGVKLPTWVVASEKKSGKLRHPEKLRRNQPKEEVISAEAETPSQAEGGEPAAE
jgi:small subunit ribosomal protein S16